MKVELVGNEWRELPDNSPRGIYLDGYLKEKLDNINKIISKGWDAVFLIDGKERSGKSTLGMTCAWYLSKGKITINNFAKGIEDAKKKVRELPDNSFLFLDEGSLVFNSRDTIRRENVELQKIMDVVGQKNITFIVVLPSIFDLSRAIATRRSLFLLHVYTDDEWKRGRFAYYGEEKKLELYDLGKKSFNKYVVDPEWYGVFTKFELPFQKEYLELKKQTLDVALNGEKGDKPDLKKEIWALKYKIYQLMKAVPLKTQGDVSKIMGIHVRNLRTWEQYGGRIAQDGV